MTETMIVWQNPLPGIAALTAAMIVAGVLLSARVSRYRLGVYAYRLWQECQGTRPRGEVIS